MKFVTFPRAPHSITDLPNVSVALGEELRRAGIQRPHDLVLAGAEEAWQRIRENGRHDDIHTLLALEGAVQGLDWRAITGDRRAALVRYATRAAPVARAS